MAATGADLATDIHTSHEADAWNDRLLEWIESWPSPIGVSLSALTLGIGLLMHLLAWGVDLLPTGEFSTYVFSLPVYPFGVLAILAIQNRVSVSALARFRPATDFGDADFEQVQYDLTHQPPRSAWVSAIAFGALGVVIEVSKEGAIDYWVATPVLYLIWLVMSFAFYAFAGPWLVRTYRLLRLVARLHREARHVDLLRPDPLHAFSTVTAVVGLSLIAITTLSATTDPQTHGTAAGLLLTVTLIVFALACFVLPLWGMHRRLQAERARMVDDVGRRIETALHGLYLHVDADATGATEHRDRMLALVATRDMVSQLSTWPWRPETPRWLFSALVIPIAIWGVTRFLEQTGL